MPQPIHELDVDYDAQIREIRRLISTTTDPERQLVLEEQLRELEVASIQHEQDNTIMLTARPERRKSFRPNSAKPRTTLTPLAEDKEVHSSAASFHELEAHRKDKNTVNLVIDVLSTSYDEQYPPSNILTSDHRTYWLSSGMFPQLLRLTLREATSVGAVEVTCRHVRKLQLRSAPSRSNPRRRVVADFEFPSAESGKINTHRFAVDDASETMEILELCIESGYSDFAVVHFVRLCPSVDTIASTGDER